MELSVFGNVAMLSAGFGDHTVKVCFNRGYGVHRGDEPENGVFTVLMERFVKVCDIHEDNLTVRYGQLPWLLVRRILSGGRYGHPGTRE